MMHSLRNRLFLSDNDLVNAAARQRNHCTELIIGKCVTLGCSLNLDETTCIVHDDIHIRFSL